MAHINLVGIMFSALVLGALTECATSTGNCARIDSGTDAATLLQAEAIAGRRSVTKSKHNFKSKHVHRYLQMLATKAKQTAKAFEPDQEIKETFDNIDAIHDLDGEITEMELADVLQGIGLGHLAPDMIKDVDLNGDGKIEYDEFEAKMLEGGILDSATLLQSETVATKHLSTVGEMAQTSCADDIRDFVECNGNPDTLITDAEVLVRHCACGEFMRQVRIEEEMQKAQVPEDDHEKCLIVSNILGQLERYCSPFLAAP